MKHNFCIVLEKINVPYVQNIEFYGSITQANKAFLSLAFALANSEYEGITLFCGQNPIQKTTFKK